MCADSSRDSPDSSKRFAPRIGCQSEGTRNPTGQQQQHKKPSLLTFESKQKARFPPLSSGPQASQKKWSGKAAKAKGCFLPTFFVCKAQQSLSLADLPCVSTSSHPRPRHSHNLDNEQAKQHTIDGTHLPSHCSNPRCCAQHAQLSKPRLSLA